MTIWGILTLKEQQRISRTLPAHFPRIKNAFTLWFAHSAVWAEAGLTAAGHAREMRRKCVCFVILFVCVVRFACFFCVFPVCQIGELHKNVIQKHGKSDSGWTRTHRILTFHSHVILIFISCYSHLFPIVCLLQLISNTLYSHLQHIFRSHQKLISKTPQKHC